MPALQLSNHRVHSKRKLALEVLESRLTLDRSWFEASQLPLLVDGTTSTVADINVNATLTVADIDLRVNLDHAQPNELNLTLISPAGTEIRMITRRGGDGTGFHDNIIDDQAQLAFEDSEPISGERYRPEQPLTSFNNEQAKGTWHLRIEDNNPSDNNGTLHSFWIGITSPPDDHGNSRETASPLLQSTSALFSESGNIETTGDHDWFSWTATKNCSIQINLDAANETSLDTYITLRNTSGESLITDDDSGPGTNSQLVWQAVAGQTYFIDAKSYGTGTGTYGVRLFIIQDDYESTAATAFPLPLTATNTWSVSGTIERAGDRDWFSWTAPNDGTIQINLDAQINSSLDAYLTLRNASGDALSTDDDSGPASNSQLKWKVTAGHVYYIDSEDFSNNIGSYDVRVVINTDDQESTTTLASPLPLTATDTWSDSGTIETAGEHDWFSWTAPLDANGLIVTMDAAGSDLAPNVVLHDSFRKYISSSEYVVSGGKAELTFDITPGATYFIEARDYYGSAIGNYTILLVADAAGVTISSATPLINTGNGEWSNRGRIDYGNDRDWFSWTAPANINEIVATMDATGSSVRPCVVLRDSFGNYIANSNINVGSGGIAELTFSITSNAMYFIETRGVNDSAIGTYIVGLVADAEGSAVSTAIPLHNIGNREWSSAGRINYGNDRDWFSWTASKNCSIQINLDAANNSPLDTYITLRNAAGESLITDDDSGPGTNSQLNWQAVAGQTYFIDAKSYGTGTGIYDVRLLIIQDDYESTVATACPLPMTATNTWSINGTIETAGDHDWFSWTAPENCLVQINLDAANNSSLDTYLTLRNATGESFLTDDDSGPERNSQLIWQAIAGQTYFIDGKAYNTSTGAYGVRLLIIKYDDYADSEAKAAPLQQLASAEWSIRGDIDWETDRDLFLWTAPNTGQAFINMNAFSNDSLDSFLTVYDSRHNQLLSNDNHGNSFNSRLFMPVIGGETYYFESSSAQRSLGRYDITLELTQIEPTPTKIQSVNTSVIAFPDDVIKHRLFIPAAGHYLVCARPVVAKPTQSEFASIRILLDTSNQSNESLFVTDSSGSGNSGRDQFQRSGRWLEFDALAPGNFDIYVHGDGKWTGGYELTVSPETLVNDSQIYTSNLYSGISSRSGIIDAPGDRDLYKILNDTSESMLISFDLVASNESSLLPKIIREDGLNEKTIELAAGKSITIYATGLDPLGPSSTGGYTLTITALHDDVPAGTVRQLTGIPFNGTFESRSDRDAFSFTAVESGKYTINMVRRNSSVMYDCYAYSTADYTSPYLAYLSESGTSSTLDLVAGQTIYIDDKSYNSSGDYTISITRSESNTIVADSIADSSATNSKLSYSASSTSAISSSIETSGDKDWIRLTVPVSQSYKINLDSDSGSFLDCYLTIRDESGNTLAGDDDSGPGLNSQLTINLNSEKFYFAEAKGYSSTTGKYTLTIATETQGLTSDIGDLTSPQMIASKLTGSIKSSIETCYDRDAFKYTSTKDGLLTINLDSASSLDPILEIYDSTGSKQPIASNDDYGLSLNSQVLVPVSKNQTVYFVARGYSASIGSYSLSWNLTDSPTNSSISDAPSKYSDFTDAKNDVFTLSSSTSTDIVVKAAITPGGDIDVYKWSSAESCKVSFALNATDTQLDPYLRILDDKGSVLNYDDDGGSGINSLIGNFKAQSGTVYYIECKGYSSYSTGSYELSIHTTTTSAPQPFDPNRDEAPSLPDNQTPTIQFDGATGVVVGCINGSMIGPHADPTIVPYDVDTYRLDTTAVGGAVTIRLERESSFGFETSQLNPVLAVLDATMQVSHRFAWQDGIDSPHSLTIPIAQDSTIYLQIAGQNGTVGGYRLSIDRQFDDVANGPLFGLPEQLSIDGPSVSRRIQYSGDDDYFAVRTSGTGRIRFDLRTQDKNSSTILSITDANENELARSTDGIIEIDASIGIEIHAHVQGYGTSTFAYSISASSASAIPNDEAGDTILTARCLTPIQDSINSRFIAFGAGANNPIFNTLSDTDTWSFTAPSTGKYHLESDHSTIRSATVIRVYRQEGGVNAGNFFADDNHNLSGDFQAQAGETVFFSLRGVPNSSYSFSVSLSNANNSLFVGTNLMRQIGATLDDSFSAQWLALQSGGANRSSAMFANHLVSQNLVHTLESQSFSTGIPFLIVWLDPVDSILIDGSGQAIGTREQTGIVNGLTNGNISTRGNLDLIVIANPQGSSFPMTLYGVGGGRVLGGAALVGSNGSVTLQSIDYPEVSSNGLQLVLFGENKTVAPPPPPITGPPINPIVKIDPKIPNTTIIGLDPTLVTSTYTALLGSVMTAITPMSVLVASNSGSPQNTDSATIIPWWLTNVDLTENFNEWSAIIFVRMRLCVAPIIVSINHVAQPILDLPGVRDVSGLLLQAVQPAIHAATSTVDAIDQAMIELPFVRKLRSGWKIPRIISASPTSITNPALNPTTTEAPVTNLGVIIFISGCGHVISKTGRKKSRGIHSQLLRSYSNWTQL